MSTNVMSFKNQFDLVKGNDTNKLTDKYSYLDAPTTYNNEEITMHSMHPYNYMDELKNYDKNRSSFRRDNTLIINDYHTQEAGQYAKPKKEEKYLFEPIQNLNALAGDTKIVDKIGQDRYSNTLKYKSNDYDTKTMYVRPELIDGVPLTEVVRPREKTQEELRGSGVNSIRLDPNARNNQTGQQGEGVSADPKSINITKFKLKSYREQNSVDDLLKTTGVITRPEWRSLVRETNSERSYMKSVEGPAVSAVMKTEYHNEQSARPTLKEETIVNNYISNAFSTKGGQSEYRNEQSARPTIRNEYEDDVRIINQRAIDNPTYRNEQSARPTMRTDYEDDSRTINQRSFVDSNTYRNEQAAKPTQRTDYENDSRTINQRSFVDSNTYRNEQAANPTLREDFNEFNGHGFNNNMGVIYENNQSANPTLREDINDYSGHSYNSNGGAVYNNNQAAKPTLRMLSENNEFQGPGYNQSHGMYKKSGDITRSGVVEEVLARDYKGPDFAFVSKDESRLQAYNMVQNESIEASMNLTKRDLMGGGTDRIPQGKDDIGEYNDWNRREKNPPITNRVRNVGVNYIQEIPETRGYNLLEQRSNINEHVPITISHNPFINNVNYKATYGNDIIRENTIINDRLDNRN